MDIVDTSIILKNYINRVSKLFLKEKDIPNCSFDITKLQEQDTLKTMSLSLYKKYISVMNNDTINNEKILKFRACICVWIIYKYNIDDDEIGLESICNLTKYSKEEIIAEEINICKAVDYKFR
jgi:hypothetical protein